MNNESIFIEQKLPSALTKSELNNYFEQARAGSKIAREKIILHNIRLVIKKVFKDFHYLPYEKSELISLGIIGLIKAVDTFNISKNYEFSTYAAKCITNEILMFARKNGKYLYDDSLNKVIAVDKNGQEIQLEDTIVNPESNLEELIIDNEILAEVIKQTEALNSKEKEIIKLYFGFHNNKRYSQSEISFLLGMTQPCLSKTITRIIKNISTNIINQQLIDKVGNRRKKSVKNYSNIPFDNQPIINKINLFEEYLQLNYQEHFKELDAKKIFNQILQFIKTPIYIELLKILSPKDALIIAWSLGYLNISNLSIKLLAKFLNVEENKIPKIINEKLLQVKDILNTSNYLQEYTNSAKKHH